ncbi:MAG: hypothetical protein D6712_03935 [Chloroflexi bacterium]|nr:MAG: hypothetical protein D6712_03935 [Chloroflexota bacterium]
MSQQKRIVDLDDGTAMVVTDLHGAGPVYEWLRDRFLTLYQKGEVDRLIICGDLIHTIEAPESDASLPMLLDVMRLQQELGADTVIMLLGNHELPHIYGISLASGNIEYTPRFEAALAQLDEDTSPYTRDDVIDFLKGLPFYARTRGGILFTHAGCSPAVNSVEVAAQLLTFDHDALLEIVDAQVGREVDIEAARRSPAYLEQARYYLAVSGPEDPRYLHLARSLFLNADLPGWQLLWDTFFTQHERSIGLNAHNTVTAQFLEHISAISSHPVQVLVAGHIGCRGGYQLVNSQYLRLATYTHANPRHEGRYLLVDCAAHVRSADDLLTGIHKAFSEQLI